MPVCMCLGFLQFLLNIGLHVHVCLSICLHHLPCTSVTIISLSVSVSVCQSVLLSILPAIDVVLIHHSCFYDVCRSAKNCRRKTGTGATTGNTTTINQNSYSSLLRSQLRVFDNRRPSITIDDDFCAAGNVSNQFTIGHPPTTSLHLCPHDWESMWHTRTSCKRVMKLNYLHKSNLHNSTFTHHTLKTLQGLSIYAKMHTRNV